MSVRCFRFEKMHDGTRYVPPKGEASSDKCEEPSVQAPLIGVQMSCRGMIFVDQIGVQLFQVSHTLTTETYKLPSGDFELFDDEELDALAVCGQLKSPGEDVAWDVDSLFKKKLLSEKNTGMCCHQFGSIQCFCLLYIPSVAVC